MSYPARIAAAVGACLLVAFAAGACRKSSSHKHESKEITVAPGKFAEVNVRMVAKAKVTAQFTASAPMAWDTHSHPLGKTKYYSKGKGASGTLSITAENRDVYSFLWQNDTNRIIKLSITMNLPRGTEVDSWVGHK